MRYDMDALKAAPLHADEMEAWFKGEIPRRMLAIPFSGPIGGRDLDGEFFTRNTDIKADWFPERPVLWHHGVDPSGKMGTTVLGKATNPEMDEDGWWVDLWLKAGEKRVSLIRRLAEKGADLFGSSSAIPHLVKRAKSGEILVWPYWEQTLSTSPQNTHSTFRTAKAVLEDFDMAEIPLVPSLKAVLAELDVLRSDLPATSPGEQAAKAGRELSSSNLAEIEEWTAVLADIAKRADSLSKRVRARYTPPEQE